MIALVYSELCNKSKIERITKVVNSFGPLTIFAKQSIFRCLTGFLIYLGIVLQSIINAYINKYYQHDAKSIASAVRLPLFTVP